MFPSKEDPMFPAPPIDVLENPVFKVLTIDSVTGYTMSKSLPMSLHQARRVGRDLRWHAAVECGDLIVSIVGVEN